MLSLAISGAGLVTGVGLDWESSCAAMRAGLNRFADSYFKDKGGEWIVASEVPLGRQSWSGATKLVKMAAHAIGACLTHAPEVPADAIALMLCVAEESRPGRLPELGNPLFLAVEQELGLAFHPASRIVSDGRVGGAIGLLRARRLLADGVVRHAIVAGVDSLVAHSTLAAYDRANRLLTPSNSNGFVPGEAAAAVALTAARGSDSAGIVLRGLGFAREPAAISSDEPLRADGLVAAISGALAESGFEIGDLAYRCADVNGEHYGFKETSLALARLLRARKPEFELWHPADCIGETGAAVVPVMLATTLAAMRDGYAPGRRALLHAGNDDGKRAALIVDHAPHTEISA